MLDERRAGPDAAAGQHQGSHVQDLCLGRRRDEAEGGEQRERGRGLKEEERPKVLSSLLSSSSHLRFVFVT